ncbi:MAG: hypothetical protein AAGJ84_11295 [Pseudomonadota bacterium]
MIRPILLLITGALISCAVYLSGIRLLEHHSPETASLFGALDPDQKLREGRRTLDSGLTGSSPFVIGAHHTHTIATQDPLSDLPYIPGLVSASAEQDTERMAAISRHVIHLNPRNRVGRFVEAQLAVIGGEAATAMTSLANLLSLNPGQSDAYLAEISELARTEDGQEAILEALRAKPVWTGRLVRRLTQDIDDAEFLVRLFEFYPLGQNSYIRALAARGELERAHLTFLNFLPIDLIGKTGVPFDSSFVGLPGAPPFNWRLHREYASFEPQGGLYISFFGQGRPIIATQTLRLSPGTYSADIEMNGRIHRTGGHLAWDLVCTRTGEVLFELPITELLASITPFQAVFDVPGPDCGFQTLTLRGIAGEFPRTTRAMVRRASIARFREEEES